MGFEIPHTVALLITKNETAASLYNKAISSYDCSVPWKVKTAKTEQ